MDEDDTPTTAGSGCNIIGVSILMLGSLAFIPKYGAKPSPEVYTTRTGMVRTRRLPEEDIPRTATIGDLFLAFFGMALAIVGTALLIYGCCKALVGLIRGW